MDWKYYRFIFTNKIHFYFNPNWLRKQLRDNNVLTIFDNEKVIKTGQH